MPELEEARAEWMKLILKGEFQKAESLYWETLFPILEKSFLERSSFPEKCDWLILPAGLESSYYILLIKALKPTQVYFLGTPEFKRNFLNIIVEKTGLQPSHYIVDLVDYSHMDVAEVYDKIRSHLSLFIGKKVFMDLTRGKRILSVGAGIVGAFFGFDLVYIDEEWLDDLKRGNPGTEKLILVRNPFEVFGDLELKEARDFFGHYNYGAALALYHRIKQKIIDPRKVEIEEYLSEAYLHWNSINP
jgi:hypothetical protein